jgi:hypothetical protein
VIDGNVVTSESTKLTYNAKAWQCVSPLEAPSSSQLSLAWSMIPVAQEHPAAGNPGCLQVRGTVPGPHRGKLEDVISIRRISQLLALARQRSHWRCGLDAAARTAPFDAAEIRYRSVPH